MILVSRFPRPYLPRVSRNGWVLALLLVACVAVTLGSVMATKLAVMVVLGAAVVGVVLVYPPVALYFLTVFLLAEGSPAYQSVKYVGGGISLSQVFGVFLLLAYALGVMSGRWEGPIATLRRTGAPGVMAVAAFFGYSFVSVIWSPANTGDLVIYVRDTTQILVTFVLVAVLLMQSPREIERLSAVYAVTGFLLALYSIRTFHSQGGSSGGQGLTYLDWQSYRGGLPVSFQVNNLALVVGLTPGFAFLATGKQSRLVQAGVTIVALLVVALALIILDSREVFVAAGVALAAAVILSGSMKYRLGVGALVALVGGFIALASATNSLPWYVQRQLFKNASTLDNRVPGWHIGIQEVIHHPIFGLGALGYETIIPTFHVNDPNVVNVHSDYLGSLINGGIIGFGLLIVMVIVVGGTAVFGSRRNPAVVAIVAMILASVTVADWLRSTRWIWIPLAIVYCYGLRTASQRTVSEGTPTTNELPSVSDEAERTG